MRRLVALRRFLRQAPAHHAIDLRRHLLGQLGGILVRDGVGRIDRVGPLKGGLAGEHLVKDGAEAEDVGARVGRLAPHLLGRHVPDGAHHFAGQCPRVGLRPRQLGDPEVEDLEPPFVGDEEVLGLQIAVDDVVLVRRGQPARELHRVVDGLPHAQRAAAEAFAKRPAFEQLRDDVGLAAGEAGVVDGDHVRVVERPGRARLLFEALQLLRRGAAREHFQRHVAAQLLVPGEQHHAHAAAPQLALHHVAAAERGDHLPRGLGQRQGVVVPLLDPGAPHETTVHPHPRRSIYAEGRIYQGP